MEPNERTWPRRLRVWLRLCVRLSGLSLAFAVFRLLPPVLSILLPFLLALGVAVLLNPLVRRMQRNLGWSRRLLSLMAVITMFTAAGGILFFLLYLMGQEAAALAGQWEHLSSQLLPGGGIWVQVSRVLPSELMEIVDLLREQLRGWVQETGSVLLSSTAQRAAGIAAALPGFFIGTAVFIMASYFLTADYPYLRTKVLLNLSEEVCGILRQLNQIAAAATGGYLKAQLFLSTGVFFLLLGGFFLWGQNYAFLLAFGLAVLDFIPLIGAGIVLAPWSLLSILTGRYADGAWAAALLAVTAVFRRLAEPKIVGNQTGLSPVLSLMSIYIGMRLAGVVGMILGPILTLMTLNLSGLGLFHPLHRDLTFIMEDISQLFREN